MASVMGFDKKHGVKIVPTKEASWAGVREKLVNGDLDFAHALYGMIYGMHLGIAGARQDMAVLMGLNQNGQGITLSNQLREAGVTDGESLQRKIAADPRSEEHTSELQSLMRISYAVFCLKKKKKERKP